jgi:hypothetical protein
MLTVMCVSVKWSHCLSLEEFEKWGIKMLNGDGVISVQRRMKFERSAAMKFDI